MLNAKVGKRFQHRLNFESTCFNAVERWGVGGGQTFSTSLFNVQAVCPGLDELFLLKNSDVCRYVLIAFAVGIG